MKTKIYTYVLLITNQSDEECGKWLGVSMSENGNCYRYRTYNTEAEARQEVFQNVKTDLNEISYRYENPSWYDIIETTQDSAEMNAAVKKCYKVQEKETTYKRIRMYVLLKYVTCRIYGRYFLDWFCRLNC